MLEAALEAFAEYGYEGMSVRDLARELGVSHNLIHHYYGSKWDLWKAALERGFAPSVQELVASFEADERDPGAPETLRRGVKRAIMVMARYPAVATIMATESARSSERLDFLFDQYMRPAAKLLAKFLAEERGRGIRTLDARAATLFLFSGVTALFTHGGLARKLGGPLPTERSIEQYADTVVDLVVDGLLRTPRRTGAKR